MTDWHITMTTDTAVYFPFRAQTQNDPELSAESWSSLQGTVKLTLWFDVYSAPQKQRAVTTEKVQADWNVMCVYLFILLPFNKRNPVSEYSCHWRILLAAASWLIKLTPPPWVLQLHDLIFSRFLKNVSSWFVWKWELCKGLWWLHMVSY